jgi:hypothetical protein
MANGATSVPQGFQKCTNCKAVGPPCDVCHGTGKGGHLPLGMGQGAECRSCKGTGIGVHTTIIESCKG